MVNRKKPRGRKPMSVGGMIKCSVFALLITVAAVLIFAMIISQTNAGDGMIGAVNQIIQLVSIFAAAVMIGRRSGERKGIMGAFAGAIYVLLGYFTFSLIDGGLGDIKMLLADMGMGVVVGALTASVIGKIFDSGDAKKQRRKS